MIIRFSLISTVAGRESPLKMGFVRITKHSFFSAPFMISSPQIWYGHTPFLCLETGKRGLGWRLNFEMIHPSTVRCVSPKCYLLLYLPKYNAQWWIILVRNMNLFPKHKASEIGIEIQLTFCLLLQSCLWDANLTAYTQGLLSGLDPGRKLPAVVEAVPAKAIGSVVQEGRV